MRLGIPRVNQGQTVEVSFGWHGGDYYRRSFDRSDRTVSWSKARWPDEVPDTYEAGGAIEEPPVTEWIDCDEPDEDDL